MAAGNWVDWNTGDLVTAAAFQDIQDSIVFIYADETAANAALTNKVEGTVFYDTTNNLLKAWDGSAWISAETGDISAVTAGDGLSGGGTSGAVSLALDLDELTAATVDVANDSIPIVDATDNSSKKESIADLATAMADGSTITASSGVLSAAGGGKVLQVVYGTLSSGATTTSGSFSDTGLSASITPASASNHILVLAQHNYHFSTGSSAGSSTIKLLRDSTDVWGHDLSSANQIFIRATGASAVTVGGSQNITFRDSPSTTSSITYKTQYKLSTGSLSVAYGGVDTMILIEIEG